MPDAPLVPPACAAAVEIARNDLALRIAMDVLGDMGRADGLAEWLGRDGTDLGQAVARLITAARADEQAQWAARATDQERELVGRLMAAGRDERLSTGALYLEAAGVITTLLAALTAARGKADESCSDGYALGLKQRAEELAANKRLLDAAHVALTAARERGIEEAAALCDMALKTIPPKSDAAAEVLHLAGRIRALAGQKGEV